MRQQRLLYTWYVHGPNDIQTAPFGMQINIRLYIVRIESRRIYNSK